MGGAVGRSAPRDACVDVCTDSVWDGQVGSPTQPPLLNWPKTDADVPRSAHPRQLDWGNAGGDSVLLDAGSFGTLNLPIKRFIYRNRRFVYESRFVVDTTTQTIFPLPGGRRVEIPRCWWAPDRSVGWPGGSTLAAGTAETLAVVPSTDETTLVIPLGYRGGHGVVTLTMPEDPAAPSSWTVYRTDLLGEYGFGRLRASRKFSVRAASTPDHVFVSQAAGGVCVFGVHPDYRWVGNIQMPTWEGQNLPVEDIVLRRVGGRWILAVAVGPARAAVDDGDPVAATIPLPRVLLFDVTDPDTVPLAQSFQAHPPTPAGRELLLGVVFLPPPRLEGSVRSTRTALRADLQSDGLTKDRTLVVFSTPAAAEVVDVTRLLERDTDRGAEGLPVVYGALESTWLTSGWTQGLSVPALTPVVTARLGSFAVSAAPETIPCGPPEGAATTLAEASSLDFPLESIGGVSATLAGRYLLIGNTGGPSAQQGVLHVLAMRRALDLSGFALRRVGVASGNLAMGGQFESFSRLIYDAETQWVHGSVRASYGWLGLRLPPEAAATALFEAVEEDLGGTAFYPQPADFLGACALAGLTAPSTYQGLGGVQSIAERYLGNTVPNPVVGSQLTSDCRNVAAANPVADQLPANLTGQVALQTWSSSAFLAPDQAMVGFGYEHVGGTVLCSPHSEVLLFVDRGSEACYAFDAEPEIATTLDVTPFVSRAADAAAAPMADPDRRLIAVSSRLSPVLRLFEWEFAASRFSADLGELGICWQWPPGAWGAPFRAQGIRRLAEVVAPGGFGATTHFACAFEGRLDSPGRFEIALVPVDGVLSAPGLGTDVSDEVASVLWRFPRDGSTVEIVVGSTVVQRTVGIMDVWDIRQVGPYLLAWVNEHTPAGGTSALAAHHVAVLELVPADSAVVEAQTDADGIETWLTGSASTGPVLALQLVRLVQLSTAHLNSQAEGNRLAVSADGRFVVATGGPSAGAYVLYLGEDPAHLAPALPRVVAGLYFGPGALGADQAGVSHWRGWQNSVPVGLNDPLQLPATAGFRAPVRPTWPLDRSRNQVEDFFPSNCAAVHQSPQGTYVFLNTVPMTVWLIDEIQVDQVVLFDDPDAPERVLRLVAGLCGTEGRYREVLGTSTHDYWVGDPGGLAVPTCGPDVDFGCCTPTPFSPGQLSLGDWISPVTGATVRIVPPGTLEERQ